MNLEETSLLIESSIQGLQVDPILCRTGKTGQWNLKIKDSTVWVDVFNFQTNPEKWYIQIMSPLVPAPDMNKEAFYTDLAEINYQLYNVSLCKKENWIYVMHLRETEGLGQTEIDRAIDRVAAYSTEYFGKLDFKYKNSWLPKPNANPN